MIVYTLDDAARELGIALSTLKTWKEKGAPCQQAPYDTDALAAWRGNTAHNGSIVSDTGENLSEQKIRADIELKHLQSRLKEYELKEKNGQLMSCDECLDSQTTLANTVRAEILNMPNSYADKIQNITNFTQAQRILKAMAEEMLQRLFKKYDKATKRKDKAKARA